MRCVKEGGAHAVKLEGGSAVAATIERIVAAEIPVMGHVGLTPQAIHRMGGHRVQGRGEGGARERARGRARGRGRGRVRRRARRHAGRARGARSRAQLAIPTIGIGAGVDCDGQVLVMHDLLGLSDGAPSFAKQYANLGALTVAGGAPLRRRGREREVPRSRALLPVRPACAS